MVVQNLLLARYRISYHIAYHCVFFQFLKLFFLGTKLHLGSKKESFIAQLRKDAHFLASLNIMDYSLLVGIHDRKARASNVGGGSGGGGGLTIDAPMSSASSSTPTPHSHEKLPFHLQGAGERLSGGVGDAASLSSDEGFVDGMESPSPRGGGGAMANSGGPQSSPSSISPLSQKRLSIASRSNTPFRRGSYSQLLPQPPSNHGQVIIRIPILLFFNIEPNLNMTI